MPKRSGLTAKQRRFVEQYLIDLNATQAAIRAGYSERTANKVGPRMLVNVGVVTAVNRAIEERSKRTEITQDSVLQELGRIGFSDMRQFTQWGPDGVVLNDCATLDADAARCVAEVSQTTSKDGGSLKFRLHDKVSALEKLGKHLGMFVDRHELTGANGAPLLPPGAIQVTLVAASHAESNGDSD